MSIRKFLILAALFMLVVAGCQRGTDNMETTGNDPSRGSREAHADGDIVATARLTGEQVAVPPELAPLLAENSRRQAGGLDNATVAVHRAYHYCNSDKRFDLEPDVESEYKLVAIEVTFNNYSSDFDLDDVDIVDADSGDNYGSDPHLEGIVGDGEFADIDDPDVMSPGEPIHALLIYLVPLGCDSVQLSYWGNLLTENAVPLAPDGPAIPKPRIESCFFFKAGSASPEYDRYYALLQVADWYRTQEVSLASLVCANEGQGYIDRYIEIDEEGHVLKTELQLRPHRIDTRRFIIEFWVPHGESPKSLRHYFAYHPVTPRTFEITESALAALGEAPISSWAKHRALSERFPDK